jgi:hypothetical protein
MNKAIARCTTNNATVAFIFQDPKWLGTASASKVKSGAGICFISNYPIVELIKSIT